MKFVLLAPIIFLFALSSALARQAPKNKEVQIPADVASNIKLQTGSMLVLEQHIDRLGKNGLFKLSFICEKKTGKSLKCVPSSLSGGKKMVKK